MDQREKDIYRVTLTGTAVNAGLIILKFISGFVGRSSAMVADAVHSLSDFVTDVIVLVFVRIANKPRDRSHEYGHGKFETMATLIIGVILAAAGLALMADGISLVVDSVNGKELPRPAMVALVVAVISILSKEWLYHYTIGVGKRVDSKAVIANAWHHRSDAISSGGTLIGIAGAMFLGDRWRILDPIAAIVVSVFIIKSGYDIMRPCISELLEAALPEEQQREIEQLIQSINGICDLHNLRTRRIGNNIVVDVHVKMDGQQSLSEAHAKASSIETAFRHQYGSGSIINIHMEPFSGSNMRPEKQSTSS